MWQDLWTALALMLVIEGILPFASPRGFREMMRMVGEMDDKALRNGGLFTMLAKHSGLRTLSQPGGSGNQLIALVAAGRRRQL